MGHPEQARRRHHPIFHNHRQTAKDDKNNFKCGTKHLQTSGDDMYESRASGLQSPVGSKVIQDSIQSSDSIGSQSSGSTVCHEASHYQSRRENRPIQHEARPELASLTKEVALFQVSKQANTM